MSRKKKEPELSFYDKWDGWARKRDAWSNYMSVMHTQKLIKEEQEYRTGSPEKKKEIEEKRKGRQDVIYIG